MIQKAVIAWNHSKSSLVNDFFHKSEKQNTTVTNTFEIILTKQVFENVFFYHDSITFLTFNSFRSKLWKLNTFFWLTLINMIYPTNPFTLSVSHKPKNVFLMLFCTVACQKLGEVNMQIIWYSMIISSYLSARDCYFALHNTCTHYLQWAEKSHS